MADDQTFSTSVSGRSHRIAAAALTVFIIATALVTLPFSKIALPPNPSFLPAFGAMTLISDLLTGCLLLSQARVEKNRLPLRLGLAYLFSALMLIPHFLAFPGVFAASQVIGGSSTPGWLWTAWHGGFAILVVAFLMSRPEPLRPWDIGIAVSGLLAVIMSLVFITTVGLSWLPIILMNGSYDRMNTIGIGPALLGVSILATGLAVASRRFRDPLSLWLSVSLLAATLDVALTLFGGGRFTLGWYVARSLSLLTGITVLIALLSELVNQSRRVAEMNVQLERLLRTDALTGVTSRHGFDIAMAAEWRRARREQTALSLVIIDIDLFKGFNDRYGHPAGDVCLRQVAMALDMRVQRPADVTARIGGEEFVILLPDTEETGAAKLAERLRAGVAALGLRHEGSALGHVTISVGVATGRPFNSSEGSQSLMDAADRALYQAKAAGRNIIRVAVFQPRTRCIPAA